MSFFLAEMISNPLAILVGKDLVYVTTKGTLVYDNTFTSLVLVTSLSRKGNGNN